ncbi:MAG TPA: glycerol kinase GlpK [Planctomycetota bacterium]|nr:glycerol kinase GlpK [Planctomycetota bacterium]
MSRYVLAVDQGTTGTTVLLLDENARVVRRAERELRQHFPRPGWVEHDPMEIWRGVADLMKRAARGIRPADIAAIGLTNQRETAVLWDRRTGRPLHRAIVWQDRRTSGMCESLRRRGHGADIRRRTGLVIDAYFSATKLRWLLDRVRPRAAAFGTVDSWLLWNLTGGSVHATDPTNASRTMLFNIHRREWDPALLKLFRISPDLLPVVMPSSGFFGTTTILGGEIPVTGVAGDQQAALFGQCCWEPGEFKNTYGTGCFAVLNTGAKPVTSQHGLLTTLACDRRGRPCYALEGSVFIAGAAVQYLRDALRFIRSAGEAERLATSVPDTGGVVFVPALAGLGAPYWDMDARGAILGLTRGSGRAEIARAALESIAYQTRDILDAMTLDARLKVRRLRVDGGATQNAFLMQFQADLLRHPIEVPANIESTSLGAAFLAGLAVGFWKKPLKRLVRVARTYRPSREGLEPLQARWRAAVRRVLTK